MMFLRSQFNSKKKCLVNGAIFLLTLIAALGMAWPIYRVFFKVVIDCNEGWNAFFDTAAMHGTLYPSPEQLITNNYPPLSFYFVGFFGRLLGDVILAGRLISLLSVLFIGFFIGKLIEQLGGSFRDATTGSAFFIATMGLFFPGYVGMNDPQLLAQCIMLGGTLLFLKTIAQERTPWAGLATMIIAGFVKHNIITLPFSILLWLLLRGEKKMFAKCLLVAASFIAAGFMLCYWRYGHDFFFNFFSSRRFFPSQDLAALIDLSSILLPAAVAFFILWNKRTNQGALLILIIMVVGTMVLFLQRLGSGVDVNGQFDLNIAVAAAAGLAFHFLSDPSLSWKKTSKETLQLSFLLVLLLPFLCAPELHQIPQIFSRSFYQEAKRRENIVLQEVQKIHDIPGDVFCENSICYRAGKPFVVDCFNLNERIKTGKISPFVVTDLINNHLLTKIVCNPDITWPPYQATFLDNLKSPFQHWTEFEECYSQSR
ncbi:MAG: DUF2029 domain-containing protein [Chthoniobacterales bacterium]|nr:DUF2029 domain-containing protein [Chthoniobacterales bacterium]